MPPGKCLNFGSLHFLVKFPPTRHIEALNWSFIHVLSYCKVRIHASEQLRIFFRKFYFIPPPPPPKKNRYLNFDHRVRWDTTLTYQAKASVTPFSVTDFCRNGVAMSMGGAYSKEILSVLHDNMLHTLIYLAMTIATQIAEWRWRNSVCVNEA